MATVHFTMAPAPGQKPVIASKVSDSKSATSSGSSTVVSDITGIANQIWTVVVTGGNVYVAFAKTGGDAGVDPGRHLILDGETRDFFCGEDGEQAWIKDA